MSDPTRHDAGHPDTGHPDAGHPDAGPRPSLRDAVIASIVAVAPEADPATIPDEASLRDELDLDSMDFLNVVQGIHDRTGIDVPERDYPQLATLGSAVDYLVRRSRP